MKAIGRHSLIIAGVAADIGVLYAALAARDAGYSVYVVVEDCATTTELAHRMALSTLVAEGVVVTGFVSLAMGLMGAFGEPSTDATLALVQHVEAQDDILSSAGLSRHEDAVSRAHDVQPMPSPEASAW